MGAVGAAESAVAVDLETRHTGKADDKRRHAAGRLGAISFGLRESLGVLEARRWCMSIVLQRRTAFRMPIILDLGVTRGLRLESGSIRDRVAACIKQPYNCEHDH
jgi:hypothetical protein